MRHSPLVGAKVLLQLEMAGDAHYLIEMNLDGSNIGGADWEHGEEPMAPASFQSNTLIQDKQILEVLEHEGGDGIQFTWG